MISKWFRNVRFISDDHWFPTIKMDLWRFRSINKPKYGITNRRKEKLELCARSREMPIGIFNQCQDRNCFDSIRDSLVHHPLHCYFHCQCHMQSKCIIKVIFDFLRLSMISHLRLITFLTLKSLPGDSSDRSMTLGIDKSSLSCVKYFRM
jgi:hypothetical protein